MKENETGIKNDDQISAISIVENYKEVFINSLKLAIFKKITTKSSNLFLRGTDLISVDPLVIGLHEPTITKLINNFADLGYQDYLVDIGANIGLTSCQNGNKFKQIHMFEPNPLCCNILEVNTVIAITKAQYKIYKYGLGSEQKKSVLTVPRHNWGGAFVKDDDNAYDEATLAQKDSFEKFSDKNYFDVAIEIRPTKIEMQKIFDQLLLQGLRRGVIKLDVEGYELSVLSGIAEVMPLEISAIIIFESWDNNFDMNTLLKMFKGRATTYKLERKLPWRKNWPTLMKIFAMLFKTKITSRLKSGDTSDWRGDIVLKIN